MIHAAIAPILLSVIAASASEAPQLIETDPVTGAAVVRTMRPLEALPMKTAQQVARYTDSVRSSLESAISLANKGGTMERQTLPETMRGRGFRGVNLLPGGRVEVIVDSSGPDDPDLAGRLAWSMWVARTYGEQPLQFSLDPVDMADFRKGSNAVYRPEEALAPFVMGREIFEADMDLKYYALGYERDGATGSRRIANPPPGYRDQFRIAQDLFEQGRYSMDPIKARLWIVCDTVFVSESDSVLRIDSVRVRVHARQIAAAQGNSYVDVGDADPLNATFAAWFQAHYSDLAARHPELAAVLENAKALALARWMVAKGVGPGERWVAHLLPIADTTVTHGPALTRRDTLRSAKAKGVVHLELTGGVEMGGALASTRSTTKGLRQDLAKPQGKSSSSLVPRSNGAPSHRIAYRRFDDDLLKSVRTRKMLDEQMEYAAYGTPVSSTNAKGRRMTYQSSGRKVTTASSTTKDGDVSLTRLPDGGSHLEIHGRTRWIKADYDAKGARTALWEYSTAP